MKPSPSKTSKAAGGKKRAHEEAVGSTAGTSPPVSPPRPDLNREWKKSKAKTEDLLALLNNDSCGRRRWTCGEPLQGIRTPWRRTRMRF
jgi:hypothetical protein